MSARTARKWVGRYRAEGEVGLVDRSSAPRRVHNTTPPERVEAIAALRRLRMTGPEIAETLEMATSTVSAGLKRIGLGKLSRSDAEEPIRRYERRRAGELIYIDVKKLGRIGPMEPVTGCSAVVGQRGPLLKPMQPACDACRPAETGFMSALTTPPAWPMPRCCPTRRRRPLSASSGERSPSTALTGSWSRS